MSAEPAPLRVIDDQGEIAPACPSCEAISVQLRGAETELRAWRVRYENLKRDLEREAREDAKWPQAVEVFNAWRVLLSHKGCKWDGKRFFLVRPFLEKDGVAMCQRALAGAWFDAWAPTRRNGTAKRLDEWDRVFKDRSHFEEFANKAPKGWELIFASDESLKHHAAMPFADRKPVKLAAEAPESEVEQTALDA